MRNRKRQTNSICGACPRLSHHVHVHVHVHVHAQPIPHYSQFTRYRPKQKVHSCELHFHLYRIFIANCSSSVTLHCWLSHMSSIQAGWLQNCIGHGNGDGLKNGVGNGDGTVSMSRVALTVFWQNASLGLAMAMECRSASSSSHSIPSHAIPFFSIPYHRGMRVENLARSTCHGGK